MLIPTSGRVLSVGSILQRQIGDGLLNGGRNSARAGVFTPGADAFETKDLPEVHRLAEHFEQARLAGDKGTLIHLLADNLL